LWYNMSPLNIEVHFKLYGIAYEMVEMQLYQLIDTLYHRVITNSRKLFMINSYSFVKRHPRHTH
jgi:hypothetical protein